MNFSVKATEYIILAYNGFAGAAPELNTDLATFAQLTIILYPL